jgi:hypothetical protein
MNNTPESFIVGIGASGALLAGAAIVFVTLVGLVSFNVWPTGRDASVERNIELSAATPGGSSTSGAAAPVSVAAGQLASTNAGAGPAGGSGGGNDQGSGGKGGQPKAGLNTPAPTTPPSTGDTGSSGGGDTSTPGTASKSPAHSVHPTHPDTPHQNDPNVPRGKDSGTNGSNGSNGVDSDQPVTSKGPFSRPTPPSSDTGTTSFPRGHGFGRSNH